MKKLYLMLDKIENDKGKTIKIKNKRLDRRSATCLAALFGTMICSADPVPINFTLSLNTSKDPGATYNNMHRADAGTADSFVVGFQIKLNSVDGTTLTMTPVAAFCAELQESISATTYNTFHATDLNLLSAGRAGEAGTASSAIPIGGIGSLRASRVNYLFEQYYLSEALSEWTVTDAEPRTQAFQLALWEITHDDDLNLANTSGNIYIGTQNTDATSVRRNNAISLAQSMLDDVLNANIQSGYVSAKFDLWGLVNEGAPGSQDVVLALKKDSTNHETAGDLLPTPTIPEPAVISFVMLAGIGTLFIKRRFLQ